MRKFTFLDIPHYNELYSFYYLYLFFTRKQKRFFKILNGHSLLTEMQTIAIHCQDEVPNFYNQSYFRLLEHFSKQHFVL